METMELKKLFDTAPDGTLGKFDFLGARKLLIPAFDSVRLLLVGCGGTGSWLAPAVVRIAKVLKERGKKVKIVFYDPDQVEKKNTYRQNFCGAEIGHNKAESLAFRYGISWGIEVTAIPERFERKYWPEWLQNKETVVVIGCVDNPAGRQAIQDYAQANNQRVWWLDCGNEFASGQILVGRHGLMPKDAFDLPDLVTWFPSPGLQHGELVTPPWPSPEGEGNIQTLSCAEMAIRDAQGLAINQVMAAHAADYLLRLVVTRDLRKYATYIDLESGSVRSKYLSDPADVPPDWK
jgi:PRTRC genetic system ThiF family protein